jgi:hypothetical protein
MSKIVLITGGSGGIGAEVSHPELPCDHRGCASSKLYRVALVRYMKCVDVDIPISQVDDRRNV